MADIKPGDVIRAGGAAGRVIDVYRSQYSGETLIKVLLARNVARGQPFDLIPYDADLIQPATLAELQADIEKYRGQVVARFDELEGAQP